MRGLTDAERRVLEPGPPGEWAPDAALQSMIDRGLAIWSPDPEQEGVYVFKTTLLGRWVLRLDALARDEVDAGT